VQILRAADETDRSQAEAVIVQRRLGRGDDLGVVGQAEVVVGAEVQYLAALERFNLDTLRRRDLPLALVQPVGFDLRQLVLQSLKSRLIAHSR
jgi:hypothetical protein